MCLRSRIGSMRHLRLRAGEGALKVDIAYGGDSFVIVDMAALGFAIRTDEARDFAETGIHVIAAANDQLGFTHPEGHRQGPHLLLSVR
jgi:proline racemase